MERRVLSLPWRIDTVCVCVCVSCGEIEGVGDGKRMGMTYSAAPDSAKLNMAPKIMTWSDTHQSGGSWPLRRAGRSLRSRKKCVTNTHSTHSHTSPLLPPNKPQRRREIPVTKIQLKQLICTDISSRALERCTAEPLLHCTTHTALLPRRALQPWGRDTGSSAHLPWRLAYQIALVVSWNWTWESSLKIKLQE